ncbi:MAG: ABC transporter substrate-binding protein [Steroidobacteraceae bacterium]
MEELAQLGWIDGRNARIEERWTDADSKRASALATELIASQPEVILSSTTPVTAALHRGTTTIPIVFTVVVDPVRAGFVASLPRPGGNITGFRHTEPTFGGKWLNLLKEIAPRIKRAAITFNPDTAPDRGNFFLDSFESAARSLAVEPVTVAVRSDGEIETAITALGREQAGLDPDGRRFHGRSLPSGYFLDRGQQGAVDFRGARICRGWRPGVIWA